MRLNRGVMMKINEVSKKFDLSIDTLRFYEKIGLLEPIERVSGIRYYQQKDIERINVIKCMKKTGMSLETIKEYFDLLSLGNTSLLDRLDLLKKNKEKALKELEVLKQSIEFLEHKIEYTENEIKKEGLN